MDYRPFGRLGWQVSHLGFGAAWLGNLRERTRSIEPCRNLVRNALGCGINYIDTARLYEPSEAILGELLEGETRPYYLATKAGLVPGDFDYTRDAVLRSAEVSLKLLRRTRIALLQLHEAHSVPWDRIMGPDGALAGLRTLKEQGVVRGIGITGREPAVLARLVDTGEFDSVLTYADYDVTGTLARDLLLPVARRHNVAVVLGSPLRCGALTPDWPARIDRLPAALAAKIRRLAEHFSGDRRPLHHAALRYLWDEPDAAVLLSGFGAAGDLTDVLAAIGRGPLTAAERQAIEAAQRA